MKTGPIGSRGSSTSDRTKGSNSMSASPGSVKRDTEVLLLRPSKVCLQVPKRLSHLRNFDSSLAVGYYHPISRVFAPLVSQVPSHQATDKDYSIVSLD